MVSVPSQQMPAAHPQKAGHARGAPVHIHVAVEAPPPAPQPSPRTLALAMAGSGVAVAGSRTATPIKQGGVVSAGECSAPRGGSVRLGAVRCGGA